LGREPEFAGGAADRAAHAPCESQRSHRRPTNPAPRRGAARAGKREPRGV